MTDFGFTAAIYLLTTYHGFLAGADTPGIDEVTRGLEARHAAFSSLSNLGTKFAIKYEHIAGPRNFALESAVVETKRAGDKLWLRIDASEFGGRTSVYSYAWDGHTSTSIDDNEYYVKPVHDLRIFHYNYYVDYLGHPGASGRIPVISRGEAKVTREWLPKVVSRHASEYQVTATKASGIDCFLLSRRNHDAFYIDQARGYAVLRWDHFDASTGALIERTLYDDFREISGVLLPHLIIKEEFQPAMDGRSQVANRKRIKLLETSVGPAPDHVFRIQAPNNVMVHDTVRGRAFRHYGPGSNTLISSAEAARMKYKTGGSNWRFGLSVAAGAVVVACVYVFIRRRAR